MFQSAMLVHQKASSTKLLSHPWINRPPKNTGPDSTLELTATKTSLAAASNGGRYIVVILITRKFNITFWIPLSPHVEDQSWSPVAKGVINDQCQLFRIFGKFMKIFSLNEIRPSGKGPNPTTSWKLSIRHASFLMHVKQDVNNMKV